MKRVACAAMLGLLLAAGCRVKDDDDGPEARRGVAVAAEDRADLQYADERELTPEEIAKGRLSSEWAEVVELDTTGSGAPVNNPEKWEQISVREMNRSPIFLPLSGDVAGPSVLRVQILLDRALFSPGMMDGRWGKNTAKAVYFFQRREGLRPTARVDSATFARLAQVAGNPGELVRGHRLTADDVKGPFVDIPDNIQAQATLDCSCYESLGEKLSEQFHVDAEVLKKLNPGVELDNLTAGRTLNAPNVRDAAARTPGQVAKLVVSGQGSYVQAVDAQGRILYHFPSTLGATYDPSPSGHFTVRRITKNPWWHFQPELIESAPDTATEAKIPPGPNNRVGMVWMALSAPHYGIHGTNKPETIGYATSSGCVRLTNWDALFLADRIRSGTPVEFRDIQGRRGGQAFGDEGMTGGGSGPDSAAGGGTSTRRTGSGTTGGSWSADSAEKTSKGGRSDTTRSRRPAARDTTGGR